ncbi:phosphotransferase family protein [Kutzneria sp. NPDC052558]|uniref:phosphotransferase family protein n=1 Tax=Kutzneria sp. NPDC052558 TaxID=3364121 RepID=UPI0037C9E3EF
MSVLDVDRLRPWLAEHVPGLDAATATAREITGGRSNLTVEIADGVTSVVLRRPPLGHVLATAHDMGREFRAMAALTDSPVPVPALLAYCDDTAVLGAPFYVMAKAPGAVYRTDADLAGLSGQDGVRVGHALIDTLADLHSLSWQEIGLADFGRPDGYLDRQLRRWARQLAASRTRELPGIDELATELARRRPESGPATLVHGDYRIDNVLLTPSGEVAAVLDWELATLGDPLADLGTFCMYWDGFAGLGLTVPPSPGSRPGWPGRDDLIARYARRCGRPVDGLGWYLAFGYYRIAVILEGVHRRQIQGMAAGAGFESVGAAVPELVSRGLDAMSAANISGGRR